MALQAMVGGAECGPVNPLSQLSKTFQQDRSLQQDRFAPDGGAPVAGPSSFRGSGFRARGRQQPHVAHDDVRQRFFAGAPGAVDRFDMAPLGRALTPPVGRKGAITPERSGSKAGTPPPPAWASDFMALDPAFAEHPANGMGEVERARMEGVFGQAGWQQDFMTQQPPSGVTGEGRGRGPLEPSHEITRVNMMGMGRGVGVRMPMNFIGRSSPMPLASQATFARQAQQVPVDIADHAATRQQEQWDSAFLAHSVISSSPSASLASTSPEAAAVPLGSSYSYIARSHSPAILESQTGPIADDALAKTARTLLETVEARQRAERVIAEVAPDIDEGASNTHDPHKTRDKFAQSSFMELMRKLRDGEVKVEGDKVVEQIAPVESSAKGKGRAMEIDPSSSSAGGVWAGEYGQAINGGDPHAEMADATYGSTARPGLGGYRSQFNQSIAQQRTGSHPMLGSFRPRSSSISALMNRGRQNSRRSGSLINAQAPGVAVDDILRAEEMARAEEHEAGMREMNEVMDADYAEREANAARKARGQFQGDGGAIRGEMEDFMAAADQANEWQPAVQHPLERSPSPISRMMADTRVPGASEKWVEEMAEESKESADEEDERFDARNIVGAPLSQQDFEMEAARRERAGMTAQQREWEALMDDEDTTMAKDALSSTGRANGYAFQRNNPFLTSGGATMSRHHQLHQAGVAELDDVIIDHLASSSVATFPSETVLEREAAVQRDPSSAEAWFALGIKQQENEREPMAIRALRQALELDPSLAGAALALAVSYTNEGQRSEAFEALDKWVNLTVAGSSRYATAVTQLSSAGIVIGETSSSAQTNPMFAASTTDTRHAKLTETLIALARAGGGEQGTAVDAEVQIALGVLFNASEEYDKAGDCFAAALQTRPDDPLLYNRLGATLANSGKAEEAIQYYFRALELQPSYIRARYNLAISCINLHRYREAAEHLLGALDMQQSDAARMDDLVGSAAHSTSAEEAGVMSDALWETLSMCSSLLQRADLVSHCENKNLDAFRDEFQF